MQTDCLFCKIVAGKIPSYTVYQDDFVLAFLDIHPCSKGHTVIIPKEHFTDVQEITDEAWNRLASGLKKVIDRVEVVLQPDALNVGLNDRPIAGQAIGHVHWHIIPRYAGDGGGSMHSIVRQQNPGDVEKTAALFK